MKSTTTIYQVFIHLTIVVLAAEVYILSAQNRKLKNPEPFVVDTLKVGDNFSFSEIEPVKQSDRLDSSRAMVIVVFTTICPYCHENLAVWGKVAEVIEPEGTPMVGISLSSMETTRQYVDENSIKFAVFVARDSKSFGKKNHVATVPQTLFISSHGMVARIWRGKMSGEKASEVVVAISENYQLH